MIGHSQANCLPLLAAFRLEAKLNSSDWYQKRFLPKGFFLLTSALGAAGVMYFSRLKSNGCSLYVQPSLKHLSIFLQSCFA